MNYNSIVRICKNVPLSMDYADTLVFDTVSAQETYFASKTAYTFSDLTYIKDGPIFIPNQAGDYRACNYLMFTNPDLPNKWFYAFITNVSYVADGTTRIDYEVDLYQTWQFEMEVKQCFVVREHVNNDEVGANLKDEGLAYGPYVTQSSSLVRFTDWWLVVVSSVLFSGQDFPASEGYVYSGLYSGLAYYCYELDDINTLSVLLEALAGEGKSDAIVSMYMVPKQMLNSSQTSGRPMEESTGLPDSVTAPSTSLLNGYAPRNNKLLTYPYRALRVSNNSGGSAILRYEFFTGSGKTFSVAGSPFPNGRILIYPNNYDGKTFNMDFSVNLGEYPQCSWIKDVYANWLATQNIKWDYEETQRNKQFNRSLARSTIGALAGNVAGEYERVGASVGNMINSFVNSYQAEQDARDEMAMETEIASMTPPSARGSVGNESTLIVQKRYEFVLAETTITAEYAKSLDGYFDLYGYRVDSVKVPNIKGRQSWNYVKTSGAIVQGTAPVEAITFMKTLLDRGIRFWHGDYIGDFSHSNNIV